MFQKKSHLFDKKCQNKDFLKEKFLERNVIYEIFILQLIKIHIGNPVLRFKRQIFSLFRDYFYIIENYYLHFNNLIKNMFNIYFHNYSRQETNI